MRCVVRLVVRLVERRLLQRGWRGCGVSASSSTSAACSSATSKATSSISRLTVRLLRTLNASMVPVLCSGTLGALAVGWLAVRSIAAMDNTSIFACEGWHATRTRLLPPPLLPRLAFRLIYLLLLLVPLIMSFLVPSFPMLLLLRLPLLL